MRLSHSLIRYLFAQSQTIETPAKCVKSVQRFKVNKKDTRATSMTSLQCHYFYEDMRTYYMKTSETIVNA